MAFPTAVRRATAVSSTTNATSWTPAFTFSLNTAIAAGERTLWVLIVSADGNPTITESLGSWTKVGQASNGTIATAALFTFESTAAWAAGDEPVADINSTASEQFSAVLLAFKMGAGKAVGLLTSTNSNGSSTNSDPAAVTNGSGAAQDIIVVATRSGDSTVVATVAPTNYSNLTSIAGGGTAGASTNTAERQINIASAGTENPGTFTSATEQWACWTVGIYETSAPTIVSVTAAAVNLTEQMIAVNAGRKIGVTSAAMNLIPQPIIVPAITRIFVVVASLAPAGQNTIVRLVKFVVVSAAQCMFAGRNVVLVAGGGAKHLLTHLWLGFKLGF